MTSSSFCSNYAKRCALLFTLMLTASLVGCSTEMKATSTAGSVGSSNDPSAATSLSVSASALSFADTTVGSTSAPQSVVLSNTGKASAAVTSVMLSGAYETMGGSGCSGVLAAQATCSVSVASAPQQTGTAAGILTFVTNAGTFSVALKGNGKVNPVASLSLSATALSFADTTIGSTSAAQSIMLSNTGSASATVTSVIVSGAYQTVGSGCSGMLAAKTTCSVAVNFAPQQTGSAPGTLTLVTDLGTLAVSLQGNGKAKPAASLSLNGTTLSFADTVVGSTSASQNVVLSNTGTASATVGSVTFNGAYKSLSSGCSGTLAAKAACTVAVAFAPQQTGNATGTLTLTTDAGIFTVALQGNGKAKPAASLSLSATVLSFADTTIGSVSAPGSIVLSNAGTAGATINSVTVSGAYKTVNSGCSGVLAAKATCTVAVDFAPQQTGSATGTLTLTTDAGIFTVTLQGNGKAKPVASLSLNGTTLSFADTVVGSTSASQNVVLSNTGTAGATIGSVAFSGAYKTVSSGCSGMLAAKTTCSVAVAFAPQQTGSAAGTLTLTTDAGIFTVALQGNGKPKPVASLSLSATALSFADTVVGSTSAVQNVVLSNTGGASATITSVTVTGAYKTAGSGCSSTLAAQATCTVAVTFAPQQAGAATGTLTLTTDAGTFTLALQGNGKPKPVASLSLSATALSFADTVVGSTSAVQNVVLSNTGAASATITSVTVTGAYKTAGSGCSSTLAAQATCTVSVTFAPQQAGAATGTLTLTTDTGTFTVALQGNGKPMSLTVSAPASYVRAGGNLQLSALINGAPTTLPLLWKAAAGTVSSSGLYTAPSMPIANVIVTATLASDSNVSSNVSLAVWRALPELDSATPGSIPVGATTAITFTGKGLDTVSQLLVNGNSQPFHLISPTQISIQVVTQVWDGGSLAAVGQMSGADGGSSNLLNVPISTSAVTFDAAVRFLQQAGYGPSDSSIAQVQRMGMSAWIDQQIANPVFDYSTDAAASVGTYYRNTQNPQYALRMRVSNALAQIFVTSGDGFCGADVCGPKWEATLEKDALGRAQTLMTDVALSPIMGAYLNNLNNYGYDGVRPNQNFAREFMQLMTIGTVMLNADGSVVQNSLGQPVPSYNQDNIAAMSNALSGFVQPPGPQGTNLSYVAMLPMPMWEGAHNHDAKSILPGVTLPAGQSGMQDLSSVVETLFNHQNIGPFLGRRLIQHLVTSNPSPAYIARITSVFANDGNGTRGNLAAVVKAILLDPEARKGDDPTQVDMKMGHYMEPVLLIANVMNVVQGYYTDDEVVAMDSSMGERVNAAPSVFSFYGPDHQLTDGTFAPEAQLMSTSQGIVVLGNLYNLLHNAAGGFWVNWQGTPFWNATSTDDLLGRADHYLFHGRMPASVRSTLGSFLASHAGGDQNLLLPDFLFLAMSNSAYQVIR